MSIPPIHNKSRSPLIGLVLVILLYAMASMAQASVLGFVEAESTDNSVQDMVMSPDGKFVYEVKLTSSESHIDLFTRDTVTGMLDFIEYTHTLNGTLSMDFIKGIAMSPDGKHLYATGTIDPFAQVIIWFDRNATTGHLTYGGHLTSGNDGDFQGLENPCGSMAISPDGYYLYAGDIGGSGGIVVFQRASNGVLTWLQTTTKAYDDTYFSNINSVSLSPDGKNLYAISTIHGELYVFSIDDTSGRVTNTQRLISVTFDAADGIPGIDNAKQTVVSQDGRFLYLVGKIENIRNNSSDDDYDVVTFQRDASNGSLNFVSNTTSIVQNGSNAEYDSLDLSSTVILSPDPDQNYLYVGTQSSDAINVSFAGQNGRHRSDLTGRNTDLHPISDQQRSSRCTECGCDGHSACRCRLSQKLSQHTRRLMQRKRRYRHLLTGRSPSYRRSELHN
ncbi:MAG: beta-propeller fold lactonase family protein [Candidatus Thiodiazotropha sp.]